MPILWRDEMSVGNDLIDQDHRYLLCLFNSIELILSVKGLQDHLVFYFEQLLDYTRFHFDREERIQLKSGYGGYYDHKLKHQRILQRLEEMSEELKAGKEAFEKDLLALVKEWIVDHLIKVDRELAPHLKKLPRNYQ